MVDCSVAARWLLPDEATPYTDAVFELLNAQDAVVPALFLSEFSNVFLKLSRQRKLTTELALSAVQRFTALGLEVDRHTPDPERLFTLADHYGLSAYDATYLELALRRGLPLACWDGGLKLAAVKAGLFLDIPSR
ncbi:type II toxin-antitoxin system VapC family toxin [Thiobacillus denitrificans]|uniref:type II toxin-antitoxin system VapC family toxin n=1 Tax=Thiobacillus denitrificans TaxID=36861 RepID=UPI001EDBD09B|nr:type II toxin-antitoxin system VapC family toxin [Thiobacillus denitrificans]